MTRQFAHLKVKKLKPIKGMMHEEHQVAHVFSIYVQQRVDGRYKTLGVLPKAYKVVLDDHTSPTFLPQNRALLWKELSKWIQHLLVFQHPLVIEGQYQNRLLWESWERSLATKPTRKDLYHWQSDKAVLAELFPQYVKLRDKLADLIGPPSASDIDALYPNEYDDVGYSDKARKTIKEFKAVWGEEFLLPE